MTRQAWLALYDRLRAIEQNRDQELGDVYELIGFLRLLLIELRPEVPKK